MKIINLKNLKFEQGQPEPTGKFSYTWAPQVSEMGAKKLGFNVSTIPPKQFSCPYHNHTEEEEIFIVLEGKAILRQQNEFKEVTEGDLIFFATGPEGTHQFYNHTDKPCVMFALSNKDKEDVCEYPDSRKVNIRKLKQLTQDGKAVDYYHDEYSPEKFWPSETIP